MGRKLREQRHRAIDFGGQRFVEQRDHCGDRAVFIGDAFEHLIADLLAGGARERPCKGGKNQCHQRARQYGEPGADTGAAQREKFHGRLQSRGRWRAMLCMPGIDGLYMRRPFSLGF